jgi:hypothetical protein
MSMGACDHIHTMVTPFLLNVMIWQWLGYITHKIFHPCFISLLHLQMPMAMVFSSPPLLPLGFFLCLIIMHLCLHCIFKYATHTHHLLDHWHFLATYFMRLLSIQIAPHGSFTTNILFGIVHASCSCGLSIPLAMNYH